MTKILPTRPEPLGLETGRFRSYFAAMPQPQPAPVPVEIKLHQRSRVMELTFSDGAHFTLPYEFLRVFSPSAEVRGHGPGQETLQTGKKDVEIVSVEPV